LTECQYHLTIAAEEEEGQLESRCPNPASKNIAGPYENRLIVLEFCEKHFQKVSGWIRK